MFVCVYVCVCICALVKERWQEIMMNKRFQGGNNDTMSSLKVPNFLMRNWRFSLNSMADSWKSIANMIVYP